MNRFPCSSLKTNVSLVLLALLAACGGDSNDGAAVSNTSETEPTTSAAMVVSIGVDEDNSLYAEQAARTLQENLSRHLISSNVTSKRIHCPPGSSFSPTQRCFDLRIHIPSIDIQRAGILKKLAEDRSLGKHLRSNTSNLTYVDHKGLAWGKKNLALLFALRNALEDTGSTTAAAPASNTQPRIRAATATATQPVSLDSLTARSTGGVPLYMEGNDDSNIFVAEGQSTHFDSLVLAPGCYMAYKPYNNGLYTPTVECPENNPYVLAGLAARASDKKLSCMTGYFYKFGDPAGTFKAVQANCSNKEKTLTLDPGYWGDNEQRIVTGVRLRIDSNNVVGLGLAHGRLSTVVDPLKPDFLSDTSENNKVTTGWSGGAHVPDPSELNGNWPYGIVGIGVSSYKNGVKKLAVFPADITSAEVPPTDTWHGHTSQRLIDETNLAFKNIVRDLVEEPFTFRVAYKDDNGNDSDWCDLEAYPSTLTSLDLCHRMAVYGAYYTDTAAVSSCYAGCDASYDYCKQEEAELQECKSNPTNNCTMQVYFCEADLDACNAPCTDENTRVITMDITPMRGLENIVVERSWQNVLTDDTAGATETGITSRLHVSGGFLNADVAWTLCSDAAQTDCVSDVSTLTASQIAFDMRSILEAVPNETCGGTPDINLYLDSLDLFDIANWNVDALVEDISAQAASDINGNLDWIETSVYEIVNHSLQAPYQQAMKSVTDTLQTEIRERAREKPLLPCS